MSLTIGVIRRTIQEAQKSEYRIKIGATIFSKSSIISSGHNQIRSSTIPDKYKDWNNSLHAEIAAILRCKDWSVLKGCSILVLKISKTLELLSNAKPCKRCIDSLYHVGIKNIYYSDNKGQISRCSIRDMHQPSKLFNIGSSPISETIKELL